MKTSRIALWILCLALVVSCKKNGNAGGDVPENVLSNAEIELTGYCPSKYYPERMRLVKYWDEEQEREFMFLTNAIGLKALLVAELYKNRWQIELFFKWLKQHLKIKKFWGTSENAVKTQIYVAIITYCLVAVVKHDMRLERSTYQVLQKLSITLTDKTPLKDLFDKTDYHDVKEQIDNSGLLLFKVKHSIFNRPNF